MHSKSPKDSACGAHDRQLCLTCAKALTCGANAEVLRRCKLTVMNSAELGASALQKNDRHVGWKTSTAPFIRLVGLILRMLVGIISTMLHIRHTHTSARINTPTHSPKCDLHVENEYHINLSHINVQTFLKM